MISTPQLAIKAIGVTPPTGSVYLEHDAYCSMCGATISAGESTNLFKKEKTDSFGDFADMALLASPYICTACTYLWQTDFLQKYAKAIVCNDGYFPFASNDHIAHWLLNPPEPPFAMFISDQKMQHMLWRTPVNMNREVFRLRYGEKILVIRRAVLAEAIQHVRLLTEAYNQRLVAVAEENGRKIKSPGKKTPFLGLDRELSRLNHGLLVDLLRKHPDPVVQQSVQFINNLTAGELWGLTSVLHAAQVDRPASYFPTQDKDSTK